MRAIQLDTDCEGPLALNDNAFELCRDFLGPDGDRFFQQVSRYDDYLAGVVKKSGYKAGDTLKLILPFLKAHGVTNKMILEYSLKTIMLVPDAEAAYRFLHGFKFPIFEISTSYRQFAEAVGIKLGFDPDHIFCTELDLDQFKLRSIEAEELHRLYWEIVAAPEIELPGNAASLADLPNLVQEAIRILDYIFWEKLPAMEIGAIYQEVNPIGGSEKAKAMSYSLEKTGLSRADTIYVGDSITDVEAFEAVRAHGGLAVSFNGNEYAVNSAEIIVASGTAWPIALLAIIFRHAGRQGVKEKIRTGVCSCDLSRMIYPQEQKILEDALGGSQFIIYDSVTCDPGEALAKSKEMRAKLRGEAVAALG
jgi:predicted HAD superfamily phosphohydrolase